MKVSRFLRQSYVLVATLYAVGLLVYLSRGALFIGEEWWWLSLMNTFALYTFVPLVVLLPLGLLFKAPRVLVVLAALLVIGVVSIVPRFLPTNTAHAEGNALRVVTFNVWGDNERLKDVETWLRETDADVVLMQEIPPSYAENGIPNLLDLYPYQFIQTLDERVWGNGVLSRYPLIESENLWIADDGLQQRVVIESAGERVTLYNVHFYMPVGERSHFQLPIDNPYVNIALKYNDTARNRQIRGLLDVLEDESGNVIVGGDFNMSDNSMIYTEVAAVMHDSFRQAGVGLGLSWPNARLESSMPSWIPPLLRIDYLWSRGDVRAVESQMGIYLGSDHLPIVSLFAFE